MLSATANAANLLKTAQNCQKLPKYVQRRNFEILPKIEVLVIFKKKNSTCRGSIRACFYYLDFQSKNFSYAIYVVKKQPCM
jgi:hypothetical protein